MGICVLIHGKYSFSHIFLLHQARMQNFQQIFCIHLANQHCIYLHTSHLYPICSIFRAIKYMCFDKAFIQIISSMTYSLSFQYIHGPIQSFSRATSKKSDDAFGYIIQQCGLTQRFSIDMFLLKAQHSTLTCLVNVFSWIASEKYVF